MATFALVVLASMTVAEAGDTNDQCLQPESPQAHARKAVGNMLIQITKRDSRDRDEPGYTYSLGDAGTGDCPEGTERVLDQAECQSYAESRDWAFAGANCYQMTAGCLNNTGNIYYSTCNYTTIDPYHSAICRKLTAAETSITPVVMDTNETTGNTSAGSSVAEEPNNTIGSNATENTTENATQNVTENVTVETNETSNSTESVNSSNVTTSVEVETLTVTLNWHRRRDGFSRRRHQACESVGEGFTCPTFATSASDDAMTFAVSHNGSSLCIESDPDDAWEFDVLINCSKPVEVEQETNSTQGRSPANQLFNVLDKDHDGSVSHDEFVDSFSD